MFDTCEQTREFALIEAIAAALRAELGIAIEEQPGFHDPSEAGQVNRAFRVMARTILGTIVPLAEDRPALLSSVLGRLALPEPVQGTAQLYGGNVTGLLVKLTDWLYPVVIDTTTGQARYDNYEGSWGDERHLHRFLQAYVVERSRIEARKKSYLTTEQSLADGSILVEIEVGASP